MESRNGRFHCKDCGRSFEFDLTRHQYPDLTEMITNAHGALILGYEVNIEGICPVCAAKQNAAVDETKPAADSK